MRRTIATLTATLLLALVLAACGGDAPAPAPATDPATATEAGTATPTTAAPTPSATTTTQESAPGEATPGEAPPLPDSIRELVEEVAEFRGLEAPESLVALTVARADLPDIYLTLVTEEDRAELDTLTEVYRLLGYLDDDEHLADIQTSFLDHVVGFYSTDHKTLWVVTEEAGVGLEELTRGQRQTLVHEIIHALQDYHFDLDATFDSLITGNLDAELAFTSVVEGDAVVHTRRHALRSLALPAAGGVYFLAAGNQLSSIPAAVLRASYFPYRTGASWASHVLVNEGVEALNDLFVEPPRATTLILHKDLFAAGWEPEELGESSLPADQIQDSLGAGWRVRVAGSLGEFHLINYLVGDDPYVPGWLYASTSRLAMEAAKGWAGDRYTVFEHDAGGRVLVARVRFTSAEEASQFARTHTREATWQADVVEEDGFLLATRPDGKVVGFPEPVGRDVVFAIGTSADVTRAALEPLVKG